MMKMNERKKGKKSHMEVDIVLGLELWKRIRESLWKRHMCLVKPKPGKLGVLFWAANSGSPVAANLLFRGSSGSSNIEAPSRCLGFDLPIFDIWNHSSI